MAMTTTLSLPPPAVALGPDRYRVRPVRETDQDRLVAFYAGLTPESRYARFLRATGGISDGLATSFCGSDHEHGEGLVAEVLGGPEDGTLIGHLCLDRRPDGD